MSGTYDVVLGDRGRLVVPAGLRRELGWDDGQHLHFFHAQGGVVVMTRAQLKAWVRRDLGGSDLVTELLAERRAEAARDDLPAQ